MHIPKFSDWKKEKGLNEKKQTWEQFAEKNKIDKKIADKISKKLQGNATDADCLKYIKSLVKDEKLVKKISSYWQMNESNGDEEIIKLYKSGKSQAEIADEFGYNFDRVCHVTRHLGRTVGKKEEEDDRIGDDPQSKQYFDRTIKNKSSESKKKNVNESFIELCKAYKVNATQLDADELGNDVSREDFKEYFNIPADADEDPSYKRDSDFDYKKLSAIKINESTDDFDLLVTFATKDVTEDNFENGQDGDTTTNDITEFEGLYDSFDALCKKLGFPNDPTKWCCIDDRIIYNQLEDTDGDPIEMDSQEYESWKKGEITAYSCDYDFSIKFVPKGATTSAEIEKNLNIKEN